MAKIEQVAQEKLLGEMDEVVKLAKEAGFDDKRVMILMEASRMAGMLLALQKMVLHSKTEEQRRELAERLGELRGHIGQIAALGLVSEEEVEADPEGSAERVGDLVNDAFKLMEDSILVLGEQILGNDENLEQLRAWGEQQRKAKEG